MVEKRPRYQAAHEPTATAASDPEEKIMLALDLPTEPYWLDLPRGVRVEIKPVTTAVMAAAQAAASRRVGAARAEAGDGGIDPDMAKGLAFAFLVKALARHSVVAWEGVGDRNGSPLDPTPESVERLMDLDDMAAAFWDGATTPVAAVAVEGNGSAPAPSGTSAAGPSTAAAARP
jgi:hypothetical protein